MDAKWSRMVMQGRPPAVPPAAAATIVPPQIDLSDSDSNSNSDSSSNDDSGSCVIVELVGNKGKTSFVCLSGDVRRVMLDKVKVNGGIQMRRLVRSQRRCCIPWT